MARGGGAGSNARPGRRSSGETSEKEPWAENIVRGLITEVALTSQVVRKYSNGDHSTDDPIPKDPTEDLPLVDRAVSLLIKVQGQTERIFSFVRQLNGSVGGLGSGDVNSNQPSDNEAEAEPKEGRWAEAIVGGLVTAVRDYEEVVLRYIPKEPRPEAEKDPEGDSAEDSVVTRLLVLFRRVGRASSKLRMFNAAMVKHTDVLSTGSEESGRLVGSTEKAG